MVEITESSLFGDMDLARNIVTSLKNQGIRLALDDFGTGFSSLSHLRQLPFDLIKIDRSFVTNIHESGQSAAIVRAVATLADALEVPILVEGIENEAAHAAVVASAARAGRVGISASRCRPTRPRNCSSASIRVGQGRTARAAPAELSSIKTGFVPSPRRRERVLARGVVSMVKTS